MTRLPRGLTMALQLLTRMPVRLPTTAEAAPEAATDGASSLAWLPVVGCGVGLAVWAVYAAALEFLPSHLAATLAVGVGVLLTGALHEDGLADCADALGASAGGEARRQVVLDVLRDPVHGTYGVLAIGFSLLLRVLAIGSLSGSEALTAIVFAHAMGRAAIVPLALIAGPARTDGAAAWLLGRMPRASSARAVLATAGTVTLAVVATGPFGIIATAVGGLATLLAWRWSKRALGGVTGDVFGAVEQMVECAVLVAAVAVGGASR